MTKLEKCHNAIRGSYRDKFDAAFAARFKVAIATHYSIVSMKNISTRNDGRKLTKEQRAWCMGYESGYADATDQVVDGR